MADTGQGMETDDEKFEDPYAVSTDEKGPPDCVRVQVVINGLQVKSSPSLQGFKPKMEKKPANAVIDFKCEDRSFTLTVSLKNKDKKKKNTNIRYHVKQLPDEVIPGESSYKVDKELVTVLLKKAKSRSWARELSDGLETYQEVAE